MANQPLRVCIVSLFPPLPDLLRVEADEDRIANLALSLLQNAPPSSSTSGRQPQIGLLDLDIFGPSVPKLMGLEDAGAPELTEGM